MWPFLISALFFMLLSGVIFRKNIKQNQFAVVLIIFIGTLVTTTIYNGIQGSKIGYAEVDVKTKYLPLRDTDIEITNDSVLEFESYIEYNFAYEDDGDVSWSYIEVLGADIYNSERDQITIDWLPEGDSIPYVKVTKEKKIVTNNLWLTSFGLPQGDKHYYVFLPNDSVHNILMEQINEKFYKDEDQIAKLN